MIKWFIYHKKGVVNTGDSLRHYNQHARKFFDSTRDIEPTQTQDRLLGYLKLEARVLDFGCGSGRDTRYSTSRGYMAGAVDGLVELVKIASEYTGTDARQMFFQDPDERRTYEGIWACSSTLYLIFGGLADVFGKMHHALVPYGALYTSFKYGTEEGERNGRCFTDTTEERMEGLLKAVHGFAALETWVTSDVCFGRDEEQRSNMILRKR